MKDDPEALIGAIFDPDTYKPYDSDIEEAATNDFNVMLQLSSELLNEDVGGQPKDKLQNLARRLRAHIASRDTDCLPNETPDLTIATLWSAKGVTADHVYVIGLCKEAIPGIRRQEYPGTDLEYYEEQQRLFYVTVTRSKGTLVLSRALKVKRGEAPGLGLTVDGGRGHHVDLKISPFLLSIGSKLPNAIAGDKWQGCV